jgi:transposase-like protein
MDTIRVAPLQVNSFERQVVFRQVQDTAQAMTCMLLTQLVNGTLDEQVRHDLQRPRRAPRSASGDTRVPFACHRCGGDRARDFERDGHYRRGLQTTSGSLVDVRVPMLECKLCGASADIEFAVLPKHKQLWLDVDEEVIFAYGTEEGLRHIAERVGRQLGWPLSPDSVKRRVHSMATALAKWRQRPIDDPPDVLMIDGIWFTGMAETGRYFTDRKGRRRPRYRKVKRVAIVALGLWSHRGHKEVLDFEIADSEAEDNCLELLNRLHLRGATEPTVQLIVSDGGGGICAAIETAYPTVARQRCVFHKLRNLGDNVRDDAHRKPILSDAAWIYEAPSIADARGRARDFVNQWQEREPDAIASLLTDFDASIAYLRPLTIREPQQYRTTNAMEGGIMRPLRKKLDHATAFRSEKGANAGLLLTILRLNARQDGTPWVFEVQDIITMLYNGNP